MLPPGRTEALTGVLSIVIDGFDGGTHWRLSSMTITLPVLSIPSGPPAMLDASTVAELLIESQVPTVVFAVTVTLKLLPTSNVPMLQLSAPPTTGQAPWFEVQV